MKRPSRPHLNHHNTNQAHSKNTINIAPARPTVLPSHWPPLMQNRSKIGYMFTQHIIIIISCSYAVGLRTKMFRPLTGSFAKLSRPNTRNRTHIATTRASDCQPYDPLIDTIALCLDANCHGFLHRLRCCQGETGKGNCNTHFQGSHCKAAPSYSGWESTAALALQHRARASYNFVRGGSAPCCTRFP